MQVIVAHTIRIRVELEREERRAASFELLLLSQTKWMAEYRDDWNSSTYSHKAKFI